MRTDKLLIDLHYLPCFGYFSCLLNSEEVNIEAFENYQKQSYRNRCCIRGANGVENLIIPIVHPYKKPVKDIKIDYKTPWANKHCRALESAYGKAPFFEYFYDEIRVVLLKKEIYLFDFNYRLLTLCLRLLGTSVSLLKTEHYLPEVDQSVVTDYRSVFHPKNVLPTDKYFIDTPYYQVFGDDFISNLSIVDVLFCEGPNALSLLRQSAK